MNILKKGIFVIAMFLCASVWTGDGLCANENDKTRVIEKEEEETTTAVFKNNLNCPVSEDDIDKATVVKVEYKNVIYNLCCPACAKHFMKHPETFSRKAI